MQGYVVNIEEEALKNEYFRRVLYTDTNLQLVVMALKAGEEIGEEVHDVDQFLRVEAGEGSAILNGVTHAITSGSVIIVPAGVTHNILNSGEGQMKLYTVYTPPHHKDGTVHETKAEAMADEAEHFDGGTTESASL